MRLVFTLSILLSAFLLFLVQPMFARMMLPKLGGAPAVWNTAMVFYQGALLAGYAYAHFSVQKLGPERQSVLHLILICLPLLVLPIALAPDLAPPSTSSPAGWMLNLMLVTVGLPFLLVSTTSPLLQRWFHATEHPQARDPYFLYAASNAGSLLALLSYPFLVEPNLSLPMQSRLWSGAYVLLLALMFGCSALLWISRRRWRKSSIQDTTPAAAPAPSVSARRRIRWVLLAFVPSSLMLSVTMYITTDVAAVPLLWIIPLTIYLLTFIIVFAARPPVAHRWVLTAFPLLLLPLVVILAGKALSPMLLVMLFHLVAFFTIALACHGELARDRPPPIQLTEFFLLMSVGGVLGGAFNALIAPRIFRDLSEYPLVLVLACLVIIPALSSNRPGKERRGHEELSQRFLDVALPAVIGGLCAVLILICQRRGLTSDPYIFGVMFGIPAVLAFGLSRNTLRFGLAVGAIFLASTLRAGKNEEVLLATRSFFGIYRVVRVDSVSGPYHRLVHGSTLHGLQSTQEKRRREPLTYYARTGPLGLAIGAIRARHGREFDAIGAVGLGAGTAIAYAERHQRWTFYEIDPVVQQIAEDPRYFTYLRDARAPYKVVIGDGRLQLRRALEASYDLLIMDAYSSDSLPIHLLTREALELYASKLAPGGAMIFNISNRHLKLAPQMAALAGSIGWQALQFEDYWLGQADKDAGKTASQWVVMARDTKDLGKLANDTRWKSLELDRNVTPWTDNYSSLLSVFSWK